MNLIYIILGILLIFLGICLIKKSNTENNFYKRIEKGEFEEYIKVKGIVTGNVAYYEDSFSDGTLKPGGAPVSPVVEYEIDGEKYETTNKNLSTGAELPEGTEVWIWYNKNNPKITHIEYDYSKSSMQNIIGAFIIIIGMGVFLMAF